MNKAIVTAKPGELILVIEREFDAPIDKLFMAMTSKDIIEKWWIGPGYDVRVEVLEAHDGGSWKFVQINKEGDEFSFHGVFHKMSPELTIQTTEFDGQPGHVGMTKIELRKISNKKTMLLSTGIFMSVSDRDELIKNGMEYGMQNTYNKLEEVLEEMH